MALVPNKADTFHVVGFAIEPKSINYATIARHESGGARKIDLSSKDKIGEFLQQDEQQQSEPQELLSGREFSFTYRTNYKVVDDLTWQNRLEKYSSGSLSTESRYSGFLK